VDRMKNSWRLGERRDFTSEKMGERENLMRGGGYKKKKIDIVSENIITSLCSRKGGEGVPSVILGGQYNIGIDLVLVIPSMKTREETRKVECRRSLQGTSP